MRKIWFMSFASSVDGSICTQSFQEYMISRYCNVHLFCTGGESDSQRRSGACPWCHHCMSGNPLTNVHAHVCVCVCVCVCQWDMQGHWGGMNHWWAPFENTNTQQPFHLFASQPNVGRIQVWLFWQHKHIMHRHRQFNIKSHCRVHMCTAAVLQKPRSVAKGNHDGRTCKRSYFSHSDFWSWFQFSQSPGSLLASATFLDYFILGCYDYNNLHQINSTCRMLQEIFASLISFINADAGKHCTYALTHCVSENKHECSKSKLYFLWFLTDTQFFENSKWIDDEPSTAIRRSTHSP